MQMKQTRVQGVFGQAQKHRVNHRKDKGYKECTEFSEYKNTQNYHLLKTLVNDFYVPHIFNASLPFFYYYFILFYL